MKKYIALASLVFLFPFHLVMNPNICDMENDRYIVQFNTAKNTDYYRDATKTAQFQLCKTLRYWQ